MKIRGSIKSHHLEIILVVFLLVLAAGLRLWRIDQYMTFLGDEGRDAIIVADFVSNGNVPFIGPPTSVGTMYLGPFYYYMMAVPFFLTNSNPVAAAVMVALLGVMSVWLVYYLARSWFGIWPGFVAAILYCISPVVINYSRFSWNPNPAPFFALLSIFALYRAHRGGNGLWLILVGVALSALVQMHYLGLIMIGVIGVLWLNELRLEMSGKLTRSHFWLGTIFAVASFFLLLVPFMLFDLKHNYMNLRAFSEFFSQGSSVSVNPFVGLLGIPDILVNKLVGRFMAGGNFILAVVLSVLIMVPLVWAIFRKVKGEALRWVFLCLGVWLWVGLIGLSFYKGEIYDHYLGFISPVIYLLIGALVGILKGKWQICVGVVLLLILGYFNLRINPLLVPPNYQVSRSEKVARYIIDQAGNKPFNFALIAERNYDSAYQFFLNKMGHKPGLLPFDTSDHLFVVCEDSVCQPVGYSKFEIAAFGPTKIISEERVEGLRVFKLGHVKL